MTLFLTLIHISLRYVYFIGVIESKKLNEKIKQDEPIIVIQLILLFANLERVENLSFAIIIIIK